MSVTHFGSPVFPVCGEQRFHNWLVTADATKVTCKRCLASTDYRMRSETRRRRQAADGA